LLYVHGAVKILHILLLTTGIFKEPTCNAPSAVTKNYAIMVYHSDLCLRKWTLQNRILNFENFPGVIPPDLHQLLALPHTWGREETERKGRDRKEGKGK